MFSKHLFLRVVKTRDCFGKSLICGLCTDLVFCQISTQKINSNEIKFPKFIDLSASFPPSPPFLLWHFSLCTHLLYIIQVAEVALSAVINALYETNMCAIARRVYSASTAPKIGCLIPHIKASYEVRLQDFYALHIDRSGAYRLVFALCVGPLSVCP